MFNVPFSACDHVACIPCIVLQHCVQQPALVPGLPEVWTSLASALTLQRTAACLLVTSLAVSICMLLPYERTEPTPCSRWQKGLTHLGKGVVKEDTCLPGAQLEHDKPWNSGEDSVRGAAVIDRLASISGPPQLCHLQHAGLVGRPMVVRPDRCTYARAALLIRAAGEEAELANCCQGLPAAFLQVFHSAHTNTSAVACRL